MSLGSHLLVMTKSWMAAHQWREHTPLCWFVQGNVDIQLAIVLLPVWPCGFLLRSEIKICWWLIFLSAWAKDLEQATWIHLSITIDGLSQHETAWNTIIADKDDESVELSHHGHNPYWDTVTCFAGHDKKWGDQSLTCILEELHSTTNLLVASGSFRTQRLLPLLPAFV